MTDTVTEMQWFRVTRYDPALRDAEGAYSSATWTAISDVGRSFGGQVLTLEEFERVERSYLVAVRAFATAAAVTQLQASKVEYGQGPDGTPLRDGQRLDLGGACAVVSAMLREEAWCLLESAGTEFAVHVGWDLYMYIGTSGPTGAPIETVRQAGLFVEAGYVSPYAGR